MRVEVFNVQYKRRTFGWDEDPVPRELRTEFRLPLFQEVVRQAASRKARLAVLPAGFFRTNNRGGIANAIKHDPPGITVVVGRDRVGCKVREAWVISPKGRIQQTVRELWTESWWDQSEDQRQKLLASVPDRRFKADQKTFALYCCGDVLIDDRQPPIDGSDAAFVLAHFKATGQSFSPAMKKIQIPTFLCHHVLWPHATEGFAYKNSRNLQTIDEPACCEFEGVQWVARPFEL